ncbi:MAG: hypothetical protein H0T73_16205, partial [Ardenticatenales bacterium]|nr:hypothetical protein [Ardenticatenales bacterium]
MKHFLFLLRRALRGIVDIIYLIGRGWRLWLAGLLLGVLLLAVWALAQPPQWASEGQMVLRPRILREGHWLSLSDLGANYALRLREEQRVARVLRELKLPIDPSG